MMRTATNLRILGSKGISLMIAESAKVKKAKLVTIPRETPKGRALPPAAVAERTIGNKGQMHGATMVRSPEMKEIKRSITIVINYT